MPNNKGELNDGRVFTVNSNMNGATGKHTVVVHFVNPYTEKPKVWIYTFDSQTEAIEFFVDLRNMDKNGESFNKIVGIWYIWPDGSVIFDKDTTKS